MSYKMTTRRKLAISSWSAPKEGNIYGKLTINIEPALAYAKERSNAGSEKITITHLVGKAVGMVLAGMPDINGQIVFGRYHPHKSVDISFLVQIDHGRDLAKVKIEQINKKSLEQIANELRIGAKRLRRGQDQEFNKSTRMLKVLPTWLVRPMVHIIGYLTNVLAINLPALGLSARPFGSCIITSVGMMGIDEGYAPPTPWAHVPFYLAIPTVRQRPVVEDGEIVIQTQVDLMATLDHRFVDGFQGAQLANGIKKLLADPQSLDREDTPT